MALKEAAKQIFQSFPLASWLPHYNKATFTQDAVAGVIVAILLIPQGMAYAILAGLPPEYGLYASIAPLFIYALFGSSRTLAVGPVAIASLMVNSALHETPLPAHISYVDAAINLAFLVGCFLLALRLLKLGTIVNFISHSVIAGFTSAAALIIAFSQIKHLFGLSLPKSENIAHELLNVLHNIPDLHLQTLIMSLLAALTLLATKHKLCDFLSQWKVQEWFKEAVCKAGPMFAVFFCSFLAWSLGDSGISTVGEIPAGLPSFSLLPLYPEVWSSLAIPALLIALIGYIESVSVGTALASKRRERIEPNKELVALGLANIGAAVSGAYPVAGGFGRSMVNYSAGAQTTIASLITASVVTLTVLCLTPLFEYIPQATLAIIIIFAVIPLIDIAGFKKIVRFNRGDAVTQLATFSAVLILGVELGIIAGITLSIAILLYRTSVPHIAIVGRVANTEHFRNISRHDVITHPNILAIRVDESLYFANTRHVETFVLQQCTHQPELRHIILICAAVNFIDANALETLENLSHHLKDQGKTLHLSEVKGPVMDQLKRINYKALLGNGEIFFTTTEAMNTLEKQSPPLTS